MIQIGARQISTAVVSTAFGHAGKGIFPYFLLREYAALTSAAKKRRVTIFTKSSTALPRTGNVIPKKPWTWRKFVRNLGECGIVNAYGLTNPGSKVCAEKIKNSIAFGLNVIPNIYPEFSKGTELAIREIIEVIRIFREILGDDFWALELNFSCPNSNEKISENMTQAIACASEIKRLFPKLALIAKISYVHPYEFAQELEHLGVSAIHAINTIPFEIVFPGGTSPVPGGGGVSGEPSQALAYQYNRELRKKVNLPLIMGNGVTSIGDFRDYLDIGANAVSICTLAARKPKEARYILEVYG